jgi:UDP-glucuronate decarboxylase
MHPDDGRVVSNFIVQALNNRDLTIYGDGQQTRSFCYVDDLIRCVTEFMATPDGVTGPINCGNPSEVTILELAKKIIAMTGARSMIVHCPLPQDDPRQRCPDITLANELLGWRPTVELADGLLKTIGYFEGLMSNLGR